MTKKKIKYDFGGYATKANVKCSDGRTIMHDAFVDQDGAEVPIVWQHMHNSPGNILGKGKLENRDDGVYVYGKFNDTQNGRDAAKLVAHGDISSLSIYANSLIEKSKKVAHGVIREVSLVVAGANPGAKIDNLLIEHSNSETGEEEWVSNLEEAIIHMDLQLESEDVMHSEDVDPDDDDDDDEDGKTIEEVFESMTDERKEVTYAIAAKAAEAAGGGDDDDDENDDEAKHNDEGGNAMHTNVFDESTQTVKKVTLPSLTHEQRTELFHDAMEMKSLKAAVIAHAGDYGIDNIDVLFPDAQDVMNEPYAVTRDTGWVGTFLAKTKHTPFSRIRSKYVDLTADEARAKGYITGKRKKEEVFPILKRVTGPTTIYKKQKLDKDDIDDITNLDVVAWLRREMRFMLEEEMARACLVGDGRAIDNDDKIKEDCIRPVYTDDDLYSVKVPFEKTAKSNDIMDGMVRAKGKLKGTGAPTFYTTQEFMADMLLVRGGVDDTRVYKTDAEVASAIRVANIEEVEVMEGLTRTDADGVTWELIGIVMNPVDYTIGADKGGQVSLFDDFDIDFNQWKYLIETRMSGALTIPKSALVIERKTA